MAGASKQLTCVMTRNYRILSGSALKMIAVFTMFIDHTASHLLRYVEEFTAPLFTYHHFELSWYYLLRCVGRLAFPLFAFLIVEGFIHTSNRRKYGRNLLIFALISEIPWVMLHDFHIIGRHNVMFTLFWGFLGLCAIEHYATDKRRLGIILLSMLCVAFVFRADYSGSGFAFIILLYTLRRHRALQALIGSCILPMMWIAGLSFIPINMYNGQRGFIHGPLAKYLFYSFYPLHLLVLYIIQAWLGLK